MYYPYFMQIVMSLPHANRPIVSGKETRKNKQRSDSTSSTASSTRSSVKRIKKERKKEHRKRKQSSSSSSCSSSSSSSESTKRHRKKFKKKSDKKAKKLKKKMKKELKKKKKQMKKEKGAQRKSTKKTDTIDPMDDIVSQVLTQKAKSMAPMTKEEWEKRQSVVRRVYDEETGRHRLIKGDGEVIEEIVSRERHKEINRQATRGDGEFFQAQVVGGLSKNILTPSTTCKKQ